MQPLDELTEVLRQLAQLNERIDNLDPDEEPERPRLEERRGALRAEAARLREAAAPGRTRAELLAELRSQQRLLEDLQRKRINVVGQAGGGSAGGDFGFATDAWRLNEAIDEAAGRTAIEKRIEQLRERLANLPDA